MERWDAGCVVMPNFLMYEEGEDGTNPIVGTVARDRKARTVITVTVLDTADAWNDLIMVGFFGDIDTINTSSLVDGIL